MLKKIVEVKYCEVAEAQRQVPLEELQKRAQPGSFALKAVLTRFAWTLIAECKLASPAKGPLCSRYTVPELAHIYTEYGAGALSILTDRHFNGSLKDVTQVRNITELPLLRKDFVIDAYQIYEARCAGADAILLIAGMLTDAQLLEYLSVATTLGMDCLVEVHTREELMRVQQTPASIIGINNRDLKTFTTNLDTTFSLLPYCQKDRFIISESGVRNGEDARRLKAAGVHGILVGEGLVTAEHIGTKVRDLALLKNDGGI
jgi:indole-3-glycerol phosphate synthase